MLLCAVGERGGHLTYTLGNGKEYWERWIGGKTTQEKLGSGGGEKKTGDSMNAYINCSVFFPAAGCCFHWPVERERTAF